MVADREAIKYRIRKMDRKATNARDGIENVNSSSEVDMAARAVRVDDLSQTSVARYCSDTGRRQYWFIGDKARGSLQDRGRDPQ